MSDKEQNPTIDFGGFSLEDMEDAGERIKHENITGSENADIPEGHNRTFEGADFSQSEAKPAEGGEGVPDAEPDATEEISGKHEASTDAETPAESETSEPRTLTPEELESLLVETTVYGEKKLVPLKEIQANYQKYEAGDKRLTESKELYEQVKNLRAQLEAAQAQQKQAPEPEPDEYEDPTTREIRELRSQLAKLQNDIVTRETSRLVQTENQRVLDIMGERDQNEVMMKIEQIKSADPGAAAEINDLLRGEPRDEDHMNRRLWRFRNLINEIDRMDSPKVIQQVAEKAREQGKLEAKAESKQKIVNVSGGTAGPTKDGPSADSIRKVAQSGDEDAQAAFIYNHLSDSVLGGLE